MTCIVGLVEPVSGSVFIGGDSAAVAGWQMETAKSKVIRNPPFIAGYTTSFRMGQILQYHVRVPYPTDEEDIEEWAVIKFVPSLREAFKEHGFLKVKESQEESGTFLMGIRGHLFAMHDDFQALCLPYSAVGSGATVALGSLFTTKDTDLCPLERVDIALRAAQAHNMGVREPFYICELDITGLCIYHK